MNGAPRDLVDVAARIGRNAPFWTQGAGGNVSEKRDGDLFIKASGARLDAIPNPGTLARLDRSAALGALRELLAKFRANGPSAELEAAYGEFVATHSLDRPPLGRASMETGFHLALPRRFVLHFHALGAVLMTDARRGEMRARFEAASLSHVFLPNVQPGLELTEVLERTEPVDVYVLQNHGVILHGETLDLLERWATFERDFLEGEYPAFAHFRESTLADYEELVSRPMPLKHYFPDSAVFSAELRALLARQGGGFVLASSATDPKTLGLREIWAATALLHAMNPRLSEVPEAWVRDLANLPTERFRRQGARE